MTEQRTADMKITAQLAMIDLTAEEEAELIADLERMTAFGDNLSRLTLAPQEGEPSCSQN